MKNVKTLTAIILIGMGLLIGGCGTNQQATQPTQNKVQCEYNQNEKLGSYSASNPVMGNGQLFTFNGTNFDNKINDIDENGNKIIKAIVIRKDHVCMYEVNVSTLQEGWNTLENRNNVYMVDTITKERVPAYELGELSQADNALDMVDVTLVTAHGVHTHKGCGK